MATRTAEELNLLRPPIDGDVIQLQGEMWHVKHDTTGYELRKFPDSWRSAHPSIQSIPDVLDFIVAIQAAA